MTTPLPLSIDLSILYEDDGGNPFTANWYDSLDTVPASAKVAVLDQSSQSHIPGLYVIDDNGKWVLAVPYKYVDNYITAGLQAGIECSPAFADACPEGALLFKNGVLVSGSNIDAGVDTWAWMLIDSVSLPRAVDPATATTVGGVMIPTDSGLTIDDKGTLALQDNQPFIMEVVADTWYQPTAIQLRSRTIKLTGNLDTANANMQLPAGLTGLWYVDNQTTSNSGKSISWVTFGATGDTTFQLAGESGFIRVSDATQQPIFIPDLTPATSTHLGGIVVKSGLTVGVDGSLSTDILKVAGQSPVAGDVALSVGNIAGAAPLDQPALVGPATISPKANDSSAALTVNTDVNSWSTLTLDGSSATQGANLKLVGNGSTTPTKYIGVHNGGLRILNDAQNLEIINIDDDGNLSSGGTITIYNDQTTYTPQGQELISKSYLDSVISTSLVKSVNGHTGVVVLGVGDIAGAAALDAPSFTGTVNIAETGTDPALYVTSGAGAWQAVTIDGSANTQGSNIKFVGNGSTTPSKYVGVYDGKLQIVNDGHTSAVVTVDDAGNIVAAGSVTTTGLILSGTLSVGAKGNSQELDVGMNSTLARLRERAVNDRFTITTNVDIGGNVDSTSVASWELGIGGSGTNDNFTIGRSAPGGSTNGPLPPLLNIDNTGQILAGSSYSPTANNALAPKSYVDSKLGQFCFTWFGTCSTEDGKVFLDVVMPFDVILPAGAPNWVITAVEGFQGHFPVTIVDYFLQNTISTVGTITMYNGTLENPSSDIPETRITGQQVLRITATNGGAGATALVRACLVFNRA